jgi:hypothetical protein
MSTAPSSGRLMAVATTPRNDGYEALLYDLHGLRVAFWGDAALSEALRERLGHLPPATPGVPDLTFTFCSAPDAARHVVEPPPDSARPVYTSALGEVRYDDGADSFFITCGDRVRVRCDPARGQVQASIAQAQAADLWLLSHPLVTLPLMEMTKRRRLFSLHAAGLALDGVCLIFPGASGSGKSTLTLALARSGWDLLGDDLLFLAPEHDGVRVRAFPEAIDITDHTINLFAELQDLHVLPRLPGCPKRQLQLPGRYGTRIAWVCRPTALVFPCVAHQSLSTVTPLDRDEALLELAPNVLLTETRATQAHLDVLAALVRQCACFRLDTGTDLDALPAMLRPLISRV